MEILAHRGYWKSELEKNTMESLSQAFKLGYGIETDIRDYCNELVISHNIADKNAPSLRELFARYNAVGCDKPLALNIKADGLQFKLKELLKAYRIKNYFLFDMSVPEMVVNRRENLHFYTRYSDIELECVLYEYADGVWLDSFYDENWLKMEMILKHVKNGKFVSIISPEIHGFDPGCVWKMLKTENFYLNDKVMLCTDRPDLAKEYFYG